MCHMSILMVLNDVTFGQIQTGDRVSLNGGRLMKTFMHLILLK